MDEYIFRRELDLQTNFPEIIADMKNSRHFRKVDMAEKEKKYDRFYDAFEKLFLSEFLSEEEKTVIEKEATQKILKRGREELEKTMQ